MKILSYKKYNFILENIECASDLLKEGSEFNQYQFGIEPHGLGPGYGYATDPQLSIYSDDTSPYRDNYSRTSQIVNDLSRVIRNIQGHIVSTMNRNYFIEDVDDYSNLKILRIYVNNNLKLDVFISFEFKGDEFFGVYKNFNGVDNPPKLNSELFLDRRYAYIDKEYYLKLNNYLYKILYNWFIPNTGKYVCLKDKVYLKGDMGENIEIKSGTTIDVVGYNVDKDNNPYLVIKYKEEVYNLVKNDYFFFKYWFDESD